MLRGSERSGKGTEAICSGLTRCYTWRWWWCARTFADRCRDLRSTYVASKQKLIKKNPWRCYILTWVCLQPGWNILCPNEKVFWLHRVLGLLLLGDFQMGQVDSTWQSPAQPRAEAASGGGPNTSELQAELIAFFFVLSAFYTLGISIRMFTNLSPAILWLIWG